MPGRASRFEGAPRLALVLPGQQFQAEPEGVVGDGLEVQRALQPGQDQAAHQAVQGEVRGASCGIRFSVLR